MGYEPHVFEGIGMGYIQNRPPQFHIDIVEQERTTSNIRRFRAFFGASPAVCTDIWNLLKPRETMPRGSQPEHLLWALVFLKVYASEKVLSRLVGCPDEKTFRKWIHIFVDGISWLELSLVSLVSRVLVLGRQQRFPRKYFHESLMRFLYVLLLLFTDPVGRPIRQ